MSNHLKHALWVEKYRPQTVEQYIFHNEEHKQIVHRMIEEQTIPHLLLSGVQGSGKTTLAQILIRAMNLDETDVLTLNASDERGIDVFRNTIKDFCYSAAMGRFKVVHLEEADMLTPAAQAALKRFMEETSDFVRFILTCNHVNKIIPPIRSRCQEFLFKAADLYDVLENMAVLLANESVKFDLTVLEEYVNANYPDVRKIINTLQQNSTGGVLSGKKAEKSAADYQLVLTDMIRADRWDDIRETLCGMISNDDWEDVYRMVYQNLHLSKKLAANKQLWEEAVVIVADHLYKHTMVGMISDPEINAAAMFIRIKQL